MRRQTDYFCETVQKCYCQHNLQTMMQVVHGLAHPDVERLGKTWAGVPSWEMRKLNGMKKFCSHLRNVSQAFASCRLLLGY